MKSNNKIYILLSIFGFLSLFLIIFLISPIIREIEKNSQDLITAKNSLAEINAQVVKTNNFKNDYQANKDNFDKIDQLFVDPSNPVNFIEFLESTAAASNITTQISLPPAPSKPGQFINMQLTSNGNFSDLLGFIKKIENGPYLIEIENLSIQNYSPTSQNNNISEDYFSRKIQATFNIKVFIKK